MFMPFALFAASFCNRKNFKLGVGHVISFWILLMLSVAMVPLFHHLLDSLDGWLWIGFAVSNCIGFGVTTLALLNFLERLYKDRDCRSGRPLGQTSRCLKWFPFFWCAADDREVEARYEPYACFLIALLATLCGSLCGLLLLIGSIVLAAYESRAEQAEIASSEPRLSQLRHQLAVTDEQLRNLLATAKKIVDDLHFVTVMEGHENPGSPVAQQLDELIRRYHEFCPSLVVEQPAPYIASIEQLREVCSRRQSLRIERRLYALRDQDIAGDIFERR